jgi:uncharacterized protein
VNPRYHCISRDLFDALAAGGGGPDGIRELAAAQYSKHVILLHGVLTTARDAGHEQYAYARHGYDLLAAVQRHDETAAKEAIRYPSVGAWALRTIQACRADRSLSGAEPGGLGAVAAAAAIRAGLAAEIEVTAPGGMVSLPSMGVARVGSRTAVVRIAGGSGQIYSADRRVAIPADPHSDAPGWVGLHRIQASPFDVIIDDLNPFRMPALGNLASRLSDVEIGKWNAVLHDGWLLLETRCHAVAAEVASAIAVVVPLTMSAHGQVSSSSPETFGAIAMSLPPDPYTCAVTLAHEVQHLKLSALLSLIQLTMPDDGRRYYAPWRDDPRPISGLLQGAYAYIGVSGFWRQQRRLTMGAERLRADREFARWRASAAQAVETLTSSGRLTPAGAAFVHGMEKTLKGWQGEPVPVGAQALARRESELHLARWQSNNGPLPAR